MTTRPTAGEATVPPILTAVRPRQWVKNLLVVLAPAGAGVLFTPAGLRGTALRRRLSMRRLELDGKAEESRDLPHRRAARVGGDPHSASS